MSSVAQSIAAARPSCPQAPPPIIPANVLRHRVYNISTQPDLRVIWRRRFRAFEAEAPNSAVPAARLCRVLSRQQWPFCRSIQTGGRGSAPRQHNTLMLVSMPCAYTDAGANFRGALYDSRRVLNAQHRSATPRFAHVGTVRRYDVAAVGLTPYGHLADAHFYASTAAWVLTLLHVLPESVPILVATSSKLSTLYKRLAIPPDRLHTLPPRGAAYANMLLSLVTEPFGALEPLGGSELRRVRSRLLPPPLPRPDERRRVVLLSRDDQAPRRNLRNQAALLRALNAALKRLPASATMGSSQPYVIDVYQGGRRLASSRDGGGRSLATVGGNGAAARRGGEGSSFEMRLSEAAALFSRAALLTGPHGGAFLNLIYCAPGTPIVEIGYTSSQPMAYPSYYHTMARRLGLPFWVVLGSGAYDRPITAPVSELVELVASLLSTNRNSDSQGSQVDLV